MSDLREKVARALCWKNGMNPDLTLGGDGQNFLWHEYTGEADAAIHIVVEACEVWTAHTAHWGMSGISTPDPTSNSTVNGVRVRWIVRDGLQPDDASRIVDAHNAAIRKLGEPQP
jgi:hypothetical protein